MTNYTVHATTLVDNGAVIGEDSRVWHWVHVCGGAKIGRGCSLGQSVSVGNPVTFRDNVKIQNNVSVYDDFTLEDGVFCGPRMVFTNICNPRSEVSRKDEYRNTLVKRGATLGANSTIVCGITIGEYATVGAGAMVDRDVPAFALMLGIPARLAGWMSRFGERLNLPLDGDAETECPNTGERYTLHDNVCTLVPAD